MKISVFGTGYVGLVTAACMADIGHDVMCFDIDSKKIQSLINKKIPIFEPGLEDLVLKNTSENRLNFTSDEEKVVSHGKLIFICVGTPEKKDGSANLTQVFKCAETILKYSKNSKLVVNKSTSPIGTCRKIEDIFNKKNRINYSLEVCSNPEFLKEGSAIKDFKNSDRIIIGSRSKKALKLISSCYSPYNRNRNKIIEMSPEAAEFSKYASNAFLATKISFMNEMSNLANVFNVDIEQVRNGMGSDQRIGYDFTYPGCGYGGSCFPKDVRALTSMFKDKQIHSDILSAVEKTNNRQKNLLYKMLASNYKKENLKKITVAVWGLSFKPGTDDIRKAPAISFVRSCIKNGIKLKLYDPKAMENFKKIFPASNSLTYASDPLDCLKDSNVLVIMTQWPSFYKVSISSLKRNVKDKLILDGRNIFDPEELKRNSFKYLGIGRRNTI